MTRPKNKDQKAGEAYSTEQVEWGFEVRKAQATWDDELFADGKPLAVWSTYTQKHITPRFMTDLLSYVGALGVTPTKTRSHTNIHTP